MSSFGFVILHYNTIDETIDCIKSIKDRYSTYNYEIVVVDNASPNTTGIELRKMYDNDTRIHILLLPENRGYAKGCNAGCKWFADNRPKDFVLLCNSDLIFIDDNFLDGIDEAYAKYNFDVMGPDIVDSSYAHHQNPRRKNPITIKELNKEIFIKKFMLDVYSGRLTNLLIYKLWKNIKMVFGLFHKQYKQNESSQTTISADLECVLYGACIIVSMKYYLKNSDIFYPNTFLYYEEDFLRLAIDRSGGISLYYPDICVVHKINATTSTLGKSKDQTSIIKLQYALESAKMLKNQMLAGVKEHEQK